MVLVINEVFLLPYVYKEITDTKVIHSMKVGRELLYIIVGL